MYGKPKKMVDIHLTSNVIIISSHMSKHDTLRFELGFYSFDFGSLLVWAWLGDLEQVSVWVMEWHRVSKVRFSAHGESTF